jgi:multidrug transporter EmrE-like cation transporter
VLPDDEHDASPRKGWRSSHHRAFLRLHHGTAGNASIASGRFGNGPMTIADIAQLCIATAIFIGAASSAKAWSISPSLTGLLLTLALYVIGNLLIMRLLRQVGMATAFSVTSVLQLVAVNLVAIFVFGEKIGLAEGSGIIMAIAGVALITFAPLLGR